MADGAPESLEAVLGPDFDWSAMLHAETVRVPPPVNGPVMMIVAGVLLLAASAGDLGPIGLPFGLGGIGGAIGWWRWKKPTYQLRLTTHGGESVLLETTRREDVDRLVTAIRAEAARRAADV